MLQALVDSGEAKRSLRKLAVAHAEGSATCSSGSAARSDFDPERARVAAATVVGRAQELGTRTLCWEVPHHVGDAHAGALVEGTAARRVRLPRVQGLRGVLSSSR